MSYIYGAPILDVSRSHVVVCDLETSRIGVSYIYDISSLRFKYKLPDIRPITDN